MITRIRKFESESDTGSSREVPDEAPARRPVPRLVAELPPVPRLDLEAHLDGRRPRARLPGVDGLGRAAVRRPAAGAARVRLVAEQLVRPAEVRAEDLVAPA